jgi:hypothetical protein
MELIFKAIGKQGLEREKMTKVGLCVISKSTPLESNKTPRFLYEQLMISMKNSNKNHLPHRASRRGRVRCTAPLKKG